MKKIFFILLLCCAGVSAFSQALVATPDQVDSKITAFGKSLDSTVKYVRVTKGTTVLNADTLLIASGTQALYHFTVDAINPANGDPAWGDRSVFVQNIAGAYKVTIKALDGYGFAGTGTMAKATWTVVIANNLPILRLTGVGTGSVNWYIRKTIP